MVETGSLLLQDGWKRKRSQERMADRREKGAAVPTLEHRDLGFLILRRQRAVGPTSVSDGFSRTFLYKRFLTLAEGFEDYVWFHVKSCAPSSRRTADVLQASSDCSYSCRTLALRALAPESPAVPR